MTSAEFISQPQPPDPDIPRYSERPFPLYRFVPGRMPHPRRHPQGHSYGMSEPEADPVAPEAWHTSETYLFGIDLYNFAYWWECHEQLEALWHAVGHETRQGQFLQGLVQIAAGNLRRFMDDDDDSSGTSLASKGLERLALFEGVYMGIDVPRFCCEVQAYFEKKRSTPALITLVANSLTTGENGP